MHANNEIGSLLPLQEVFKFVPKNHMYIFILTLFKLWGITILTHLKHPLIFLLVLPINLWTKGIGFLYVNNNISLNPLITGDLKKGKGGGTENLYATVGLGKAMEMA